MRTFRIERTELHTRVYHVRARTAEAALAKYMEESEEDEEHSYHSGDPQVRVVTEEPDEPRDYRQKGDDDGIEYADPATEMEERLTRD
jgi:hypothetical protein